MKGIVIAGSYAIYKDWLRETKNSPHEYRYASAPEHLRGLHGVEVVFLKGYYDSKAYNLFEIEMLNKRI